MTTQVRNSLYPSNSVQLERLGTSDSDVGVLVDTSTGAKFVEVSRSEFLAAVASELDAVVIPREELPTPDVYEHRADLAQVGHLTASRNGLPGRSAELRQRGLDYLAAAEWVTKGVVDKHADALAKLIHAKAPLDSYEDLARHLAESGVRVGGDDK